jgi:hypothetical protein
MENIKYKSVCCDADVIIYKYANGEQHYQCELCDKYCTVKQVSYVSYTAEPDLTVKKSNVRVIPLFCTILGLIGFALCIVSKNYPGAGWALSSAIWSLNCVFKCV